MNLIQWLLIANLTLSGLIIFARGCKGSTRTYTMTSGVCGLIECALMVGLVVLL